jgi:hypothetical protein
MEDLRDLKDHGSNPKNKGQLDVVLYFIIKTIMEDLPNLKNRG